MNKIVGFYRFNRKEPSGADKKTFCYVTKDESGKLSYHFSDDLEKMKEIVVKYAKDNNYDKRNVDEMLKNTNKFDYNVRDLSEVLNKIKRSNKVNEKDEEEFMDSFINYENSNLKKPKKKASHIPTGTGGTQSKRFSLKEKLVDMKTYLKEHKKVKRLVYTAGLAALFFTIAATGFKLSKDKSPTNTGSRTATVVDDDKVKEETQKTPEEETQNEIVVDDTTNNYDATVEASSKTTYNNSPDYSNSNNVTSNPGTVNDNYLEWQDPNVSIDNSTNDGSSSGEGSDNNESVTEDDSYDNVHEEEVPVIDEGENNTDDDYSEEIDVPVDSNEEDNGEITPPDEYLDKDDIIFDDKFEGNEGAIDNDFSYDASIDTNENNGDYTTTEDELTETNPNEIPVFQEQQSSNTNIDNTSTTLSNEQIIEQAVTAMSNGENINIVYNADNNSMRIEEVPTIQDTNSITK